MNRRKDCRRSMTVVGLLLTSPLLAQVPESTAPENPPAESTPVEQASAGTYWGEVTGRDVYIRSGPSANYYPVAKLNAGQRVTVFGEKDGWLEIAPPLGCFSLVHKNFVDVGDKGDGVVNGDSVFVRAGSELSNDIYAKQLKLDRGAAVTVLRPHNDDFLRIEPPPGARVYISARYVERRFEGGVGSGEVSPAVAESFVPGANGAKAGKSELPAVVTSIPKNAAAPEALAIKPAVERAAPGDIEALEASISAELAKPALERDYASLMERCRRWTEPGTEESLRLYAQTRLQQLQDAANAVASIREVDRLSEQMLKDRHEWAQQRSQIRPTQRPAGAEFDAVGDLRASMLFSSPLGPRRYRLVERGDEPVARTIAYVEIPDDSPIDISQYLGRRVGVRAKERKLQTGEADPLLIYILGDLVLLDGNVAPPLSTAPPVQTFSPPQAAAPSAAPLPANTSPTVQTSGPAGEITFYTVQSGPQR